MLSSRGAARIPSPGGWVPPAGVRPGWDWTPPHGLVYSLDALPLWLRLWMSVPFLDRVAHVWLWRHGFFLVEPPEAGDVEGGAGVREPRTPRPPADHTGAIRHAPQTAGGS